MKQPRTCSVTPTHASTPDAQSLPPPRTPMPTRRVTRCVSFALGLALGTGVAVLCSLLRTWFSASTPTTAMGVLTHEHASVGPRSPRAVVARGLSPA